MQGKTWSAPTVIRNDNAPARSVPEGAWLPFGSPFGVDPQLERVPGSNNSGLLVLTSGRVGLHAWIGAGSAADPLSAQRWSDFNIAAHHNAMLSAAGANSSVLFTDGLVRTPVNGSCGSWTDGEWWETSSYTGAVALPQTDGDVLLLYDRSSWGNPAEAEKYGNGSYIFVLRATVTMKTNDVSSSSVVKSDDAVWAKTEDDRPPPPPPIVYPWPPTIHWAQGCLEGRATHDISGGIIQNENGKTTYHAWIGCFHAESGGGWQHISSDDLVHWRRGTSFTGTALDPTPLGVDGHVEAGAVGIDEKGRAFAVEVLPGARTRHGQPASAQIDVPEPYHAYRFTNASNDAWESPVSLFNVTSKRILPGDPPRPWLDTRDNRWYALVSMGGKGGTCCGGVAPMWSSPALFGPMAKWEPVSGPPLLNTTQTVLDGTNGLPTLNTSSEFVTSE
jgi:hypothetical protein